MYACMYVCMCVCVCVCVCMYVCMYVSNACMLNKCLYVCLLYIYNMRLCVVVSLSMCAFVCVCNSVTNIEFNYLKGLNTNPSSFLTFCHESIS